MSNAGLIVTYRRLLYMHVCHGLYRERLYTEQFTSTWVMSGRQAYTNPLWHDYLQKHIFSICIPLSCSRVAQHMRGCIGLLWFLCSCSMFKIEFALEPGSAAPHLPHHPALLLYLWHAQLAPPQTWPQESSGDPSSSCSTQLGGHAM